MNNKNANVTEQTAGGSSAPKSRSNVRRLVQAALIAALYVVLTYAQELLLPGTTSMAVQFRVSEVLTLAAVLTPDAIVGLTLGCVIANLVSVSALPIDMVMGSLATLIATFLMWKLRNVRIASLPVLSALMPALINGIIVGLEIEIFYIEGSFHFTSFLIQGGLVALGELGVCIVLGLPFFKALEKTRIFGARSKT